MLYKYRKKLLKYFFFFSCYISIGLYIKKHKNLFRKTCKLIQNVDKVSEFSGYSRRSYF